jgi:hypothetical protein
LRGGVDGKVKMKISEITCLKCGNLKQYYIRKVETMKHEEHDAQVALFRWAEMMSGKYPALKLLFAIPNGRHRHIAVAKKLKAEGVKSGVPDIFLLYASNGYHGFFIEMKSSKGKISTEQQWWANKIGENGYAHSLCFSWMAAANMIMDYLGIPGERIKP